jgi:hypothetical protein
MIANLIQSLLKMSMAFIKVLFFFVIFAYGFAYFDRFEKFKMGKKLFTLVFYPLIFFASWKLDWMPKKEFVLCITWVYGSLILGSLSMKFIKRFGVQMNTDKPNEPIDNGMQLAGLSIIHILICLIVIFYMNYRTPGFIGGESLEMLLLVSVMFMPIFISLFGFFSLIISIITFDEE